MGGRQPQLHGQKRHKVCKGPSKCRRGGRGLGGGGEERRVDGERRVCRTQEERSVVKVADSHILAESLV